MSVSVVELLLYAILINPTLFCLFHHGRKGIFGWYLLLTFCLLRIVGAVLQIHNDKTKSTSADAMVISSIGLSPLLLATEAILHEARTAKFPGLNHKIELFKVLNYHAMVIVGLVLVMMGVLNETKEAVPTPNTAMKVGVLIMSTGWAILVIWAALSLRQPEQNPMTIPAFVDATMLVYGVLSALPFLGIRSLYSILSAFEGSNFRNSEDAKTAMSVVPELIVVAILVGAGIRTKQMAKLRKQNKAEYGVAMEELGRDNNDKAGLIPREEQGQPGVSNY